MEMLGMVDDGSGLSLKEAPPAAQECLPRCQIISMLERMELFLSSICDVIGPPVFASEFYADDLAR